MYACSPKMPNEWIDEAGLRVVLEQLAPSVVPCSPQGRISVNEGLHFTGGEPFLNYHLLYRAVLMAEELGYPSVFAETNCHWCTSIELAHSRFSQLKGAGLEGVLISANPFLAEHVPFERIERGISTASEVFGRQNVLVYHEVYLTALRAMGARGVLSFEEYFVQVARLDPSLLLVGFDPRILLPMGRLVYTLEEFYEKRPAKAFFNAFCARELARPWHVHIDCYFNYIPGYCAGITLGDARRLRDLLEGVDLSDKPVLAALARSLGELYKLAVEGYSYKERESGYISPCHLCLDVRLHLALEVGGFPELQPLCFYESIARARSNG